MVSTTVPTPAIVFMAVIGSCCLLLLILYQCLKAGLFFKTEPPERPNEKDYAELGEAYATETDDDYLVGVSSKGTSRRSSFNTSGSKSDGELALGDSASVCGYGPYSDSEYGPSDGRRAMSAYGDGIDMRDEVLSTAGRIQISASYAPTAEKLSVTVVRAEDIPTKQRGGASSVQVRIVILPTKKQRFKTKAKPATNPNFHETFTFTRITQNELRNLCLRVRLYGHERIGKDKLLGESKIELTAFELDGEGTPLWRTLTPGNAIGSSDSMYDLSDTGSVHSFGSYGSSSSLAMVQSGAPELLVSLCYQSLTGRLTVEVLKASNLRNVAMQRAPDTYVKVSMFNSIGQQLSKSKTSIRRSMYDPEFNETFVFQIIEFELPSVSLMFSVVNIKKMRRKEIMGWFSMGRDNTGEDEESHWKEMIEGKGKAVKRWHVLSAVEY
ncbi:synaptotagmin-16 isoform X2 [Nematostella vectensis]|uniref:synaptotagmin-16 isoform X2 n=1 Tax=Nematostella vectensis TaxID=45351 RepID=UPI002076E491|nr:synaptotagmin-16 isoform X2 [Nematostella vectensis]